MILSVQHQNLNLHADHYCDLCKTNFDPEDLITITVRQHNTMLPKYERQQLVVCLACLGKMSKCAQAFLANLIVGCPNKEEVSLD